MSKKNLQDFLDSTVEKIKRDSRFVGVAVAGSWITKTTDDYSDLDLILVADESFYNDVLMGKTDIARDLGDLVASFTGEHVGEPERLLICLYANPTLHVDLKFITAKDFQKRIEDPYIAWERENKLTKEYLKTKAQHPMPNLQWIEDRFWTWVHYAATKIGRGEYFEVIDFLSFIRSTVLGPLSLVKHGQLPRGARRLETLAQRDLPYFLKTVAIHERKSCWDATMASVELYKKLRDESDNGTLKKNQRAEETALTYLENLK